MKSDPPNTPILAYHARPNLPVPFVYSPIVTGLLLLPLAGLGLMILVERLTPFVLPRAIFLTLGFFTADAAIFSQAIYRVSTHPRAYPQPWWVKTCRWIYRVLLVLVALLIIVFILMPH